MKIKPLGKRILVKPIRAAEMTPGGIILPEVTNDKPIKGEIIAVGSDCSVRVGEIVMYGKFGGQELEFEGVKYLMMREEDIMATVHE